jgi:hypothetical protein
VKRSSETQSEGKAYRQTAPSVRREQLLAQAKITQSFKPVEQRYLVYKLILESVLSRTCTSVEILEAAYHDSQGLRYWESWLFEPLPIYQFAELLALDIADPNGMPVLDRYLFQIFERLRAAAEAGETWFIGDTSALITGTWSFNSALAVRPREAIAWMCQNPNARHLVPRTPAQMAGSIVSVNAPSPVSALPLVAAGSRGPAGAQGSGGVGEPSESDAVLDARIKAPGVRPRGRRAIKLEQTKEKMRCDIREGRQTAAALNDMLEKNLASSYGISRDTARKARNAVLSELGENSIPDK